MLTRIKGSMLDPAAVSDRLGYTPVNKAGDTVTGQLILNESAAIGTNSPAINSSGKTLHIHAAGTSQWSLLHTTNGETGSAGGDGSIYGSIGSDAYMFNYENGSLIFGTNGSARGSIDPTGRFLINTQPSFSAYSPNTTSTQNTVVYTQTRHNIGNCYNTSTGRFTAPVTGRYLFMFNSLMNVNADYVRLWFNVNGTKDGSYGDTLSGGSVSGGAWTGWQYISIGLSIILQLNTSDWISVWNDGPAATWGNSYGTFTGHLLS